MAIGAPSRFLFRSWHLRCFHGSRCSRKRVDFVSRSGALLRSPFDIPDQPAPAFPYQLAVGSKTTSPAKVELKSDIWKNVPSSLECGSIAASARVDHWAGCVPCWSPPVPVCGVGFLSTSGFCSTGWLFMVSVLDFTGSPDMASVDAGDPPCSVAGVFACSPYSSAIPQRLRSEAVLLSGS